MELVYIKCREIVFYMSEEHDIIHVCMLRLTLVALSWCKMMLFSLYERM